MLEKVKKSIRIFHNLTDEELQDDINACHFDLRRIGITNIKDADPLIVSLTKLYVKWQQNFEGEADRYERNYKALRDSLSQNGDYNV